MSTSTPTAPAPWTACVGASRGLIMSGDSMEHVAKVNTDHRHFEANAHLIAAAPALLAACQRLQLAFAAASSGEVDEYDDILNEAFTMANAAVAKVFPPAA